jgi:hypothetical protein
MMVVSLRQMGITDWDKERLKMTVNMPARCSVHALRMRSGIPFGLASVDLIKDLTRGGLGERDHPVLRVSGGPHARHGVVITAGSSCCSL